jgi:hypothetical protein
MLKKLWPLIIILTVTLMAFFNQSHAQRNKPTPRKTPKSTSTPSLSKSADTMKIDNVEINLNDPGFAWDPNNASDLEAVSLLPGALLDSTGFIMEDNLLSGPKEMDPNDPIYPVLPLFGNGGSVMGQWIPGEYLNINKDHQGTTLVTGGNNPGPTILTNMAGGVSTFRVTPEYPELWHAYKLAYMSGDRMLIQNGRALLVKRSNNESGMTEFSVTSKTGWGVRAGFDVIQYFGKFAKGLSFDNGIKIDITENYKFLDLSKSLTNVGYYSSKLFQRENQLDVIREVVKYLPYLQAFLYSNQADSDDSRFYLDSGNLVKAIAYGSLYLNPDTPVVTVKPKLDDFSSGLRSRLSSLQNKNNLQEEEKLREELGSYINRIAVDASEERNQFVQNLCNHLASSVEMPPRLWPRCRIVATYSPNAFAFPGGDIAITAGMLGVLSDLDAVINVLGHELGHVIARHGTKRMNFAIATNTTMMVYGVAGNLFALGGGYGVTGSVNLLTWLPQLMGNSIAVGLGGTLMGKSLVAGLMGYSRGQEKEADDIGQQLALATGTQREPLVNGWKEFKNWNEKYLGIRDFSIYDSHPNTNSRIQSIIKRNNNYPEFKKAPYVDASGNSVNRHSVDMYKQYAKIHDFYKPGVEMYGEILNERSTKNKAAKRRKDYLKLSFESPGNRCLHHVLDHAD